MEKRIKEGKHDKGVIVDMRRSQMLFNLFALVQEGAITLDDLEEFSDDVKERVKFMADRWRG